MAQSHHPPQSHPDRTSGIKLFDSAIKLSSSAEFAAARRAQRSRRTPMQLNPASIFATFPPQNASLRCYLDLHRLGPELHAETRFGNTRVQRSSGPACNRLSFARHLRADRLLHYIADCTQH